MLSSVTASGRSFVDGYRRQIILRGVNLGGDSKVPFPDGGTEQPSDFSDHRDVSFVGRPFPLDEADGHLARLRHWGFNCVRLIFTWEAVEHAGPGQYDQAFLDHYEGVVEKAAKHGLYVFADPHQDAWSRMTGGDGAPGWTLEAAGIDLSRIKDVGAAHVMQNVFDYGSEEKRQSVYPQMSWSSNYTLPANSIMWSLFWLGRELTPQFQVDGRNIQDYLQSSYLGALNQVALRLADKPNVLGFDSLNEPHIGWLGRKLTERIDGGTSPSKHGARRAFSLSPLDGLNVARGKTLTSVWLDGALQQGLVPVDEHVLNPNSMRLWREGFECPFREAGLYDIGPDDQARSVREDGFCEMGGRPLSLEEDIFGPFYHAVARTIRAHNSDWSLFAELDASGPRAGRSFPSDMPVRSVNAGHWYDGALLYGKRLVPVGGATVLSETDQAANYAARIGAVTKMVNSFADPGPCLLGEFGIPFDLNDGEAYSRWAAGERGNDIWREHELALGIMYDAIDAQLASSAQWNYTATNSNDLRVGDHWNQEDLSIFSPDQQDDPTNPDSGGRAIGGFCRPYAMAIQGRAKAMSFNRHTGNFELSFDADATIGRPTEIYVPKWQYPEGLTIETIGDDVVYSFDAKRQHLEITTPSSGFVVVRIGRGKASRP